jgi:hypothetical protein
VKTF